MPKASGPGPQMISSRPHRSWPLIREAVCRNMKPSIELAVKPYYPAKIRQQIFFPDRKLVQFDSGKLQTLSNLLRQMKTGGHKCLIFTQMSKMLDILEVFLNLHAHTYVRLDGSTGTYTDDTYTVLTLVLLLLYTLCLKCYLPHLSYFHQHHSTTLPCYALQSPFTFFLSHRILNSYSYCSAHFCFKILTYISSFIKINSVYMHLFISL